MRYARNASLSYARKIARFVLSGCNEIRKTTRERKKVREREREQVKRKTRGKDEEQANTPIRKESP